MTRWQKLALLAGFVALTVALLAAIDSPARGYEMDIYQSTPVAFWAGVGVALLVSIVVSFASGSSRRQVDGGLLLAATAVWSIVALPFVRGYFFYGHGDALSHLGYARSFASGAANPLELLHPGVHMASVLISGVTGFPFSRALMFTVFVFFAVFFVFVPLAVREIVGDGSGVVVGLFAALLLLPINNVATHVVAHPSSQASLFVPLVLFLLFVYLRQPTGGVDNLSPVGGLLALTSASIVFIHPQETMNVIVIFVSIAFLQFVYRRVKPGHAISKQHPVYFQTLFIVLTFLWRAPGNKRVQNQYLTTYNSLFGPTAPAGGEVATRTDSLGSIGGSIEELFLKLFLVAFVFSGIAGVLMLATVTGRLDRVFPERNALNKYLTLAFVPLAAGTVFVFFGNFGDHYFRFVGFMMSLVTIMAAAMLVRALPSVVPRDHIPTLRKAIVLLFVLLLPITMLSLHASPWIYKPGGHVSEVQTEGFEAAFEHRSPDIAFTGVRSPPTRAVHAYYGPYSSATNEFPLALDGIPETVFASNLSTYYDEPHYVSVTRADFEREVQLYKGFRYSGKGFQKLDSTPGIARVQSYDEFRLYLLTNEEV